MTQADALKEITAAQDENRIPAEWVIPVEKATGVSGHLLRPDIYTVEE